MNRKIDSMGRVVIPKEMREQLYINCGDTVNIDVVDNKLVITKTNQVDYKQTLDEVRDLLDNNRNVCYTDDDINYLLQIIDRVK